MGIIRPEGKIKSQKIIWQDRSRILGLPITFTVYQLTEKSLRRKDGLISITEDELKLNIVSDIRVRKGILDRIIGTGTIYIYSNDVTDRDFVLKGIKDPDYVKDLIFDYAEKYKMKFLNIYDQSSTHSSAHSNETVIVK